MNSGNRFNDHGYWCRAANTVSRERKRKRGGEFFHKHPLFNDTEWVHSLIFTKQWIWSLSHAWGRNTPCMEAHINTLTLVCFWTWRTQTKPYEDTKDFHNSTQRVTQARDQTWGHVAMRQQQLPSLTTLPMLIVIKKQLLHFVSQQRNHSPVRLVSIGSRHRGLGIGRSKFT